MNKKEKYCFTEFSNLKLIDDLNNIIKNTGEEIEGNCLYQNTFEFHLDNKESLRYNLYTLCKTKKSILEVGFNGGHSVVLYLYSNPDIKIKSYDICRHKYTEKCANYVKEQNLYNFELIKGDSRETLKSNKNKEIFELIHLDGGHGVDLVQNDLINSKKFADKDTILIMDDSYHSHIKKIIEDAIKHNYIYEVEYEKLDLKKNYYHRIFKYRF
tara:strand:- start:73 stop:711 length:639 start_codon:yes stop_codon:yes gene_type:complete